ncbi:unnamed protein product [Brachionus calyciflorus]|uniref:Uncharacterized protein n=1 Tax=Brachionus calyciflorus TaxID=104777 RepID=A0A814GKX8_9BILA|nr:unnamed protein product [Brachionus calyciflorus]
MLKNKNCTIDLHSTQGPYSLSKLDYLKFKEGYTFQFYNQTHLLAKNQNFTQSYYVQITSFLLCFTNPLRKELFNKQLFLILNNKLNQLNEKNQKNELKKNEAFNNSTDLPFYLRNEIQPVLYVAVIFTVFTIIFALILILTHRYNKQDAELHETKLIIKRWNDELRRHHRRISKRNKETLSLNLGFEEMRKISCLNLYRKQSKKGIRSKQNSIRKDNESVFSSRRNSDFIVPRLIFDHDSFDSDNRTITKVDCNKNINRLSCNSLKTI